MTTTVQPISNAKTRLPLGQLFWGLIDRPTATFETIVARPGWVTWITPLGVMALCFVGLIIVQTPYTLELARQQAELQLAALPESQAEAARAGMEWTLSLPFMLSTGIGFGLITLALAVLAQAIWLYFSALITGGEMTFGSMFAVSAWSRLPLALGFLTQASFTAITGRLLQYPGLSFFVAGGDLMKDARNPWFVLLGSLDLFWAWHLVLVVLGLAVAARCSRSKAGLLTLLYAALGLGLTVLPTIIFGGMMGG